MAIMAGRHWLIACAALIVAFLGWELHSVYSSQHREQIKRLRDEVKSLQGENIKLASERRRIASEAKKWERASDVAGKKLKALESKYTAIRAEPDRPVIEVARLLSGYGYEPKFADDGIYFGERDANRVLQCERTRANLQSQIAEHVTLRESLEAQLAVKVQEIQNLDSQVANYDAIVAKCKEGQKLYEGEVRRHKWAKRKWFIASVAILGGAAYLQ